MATFTPLPDREAAELLEAFGIAVQRVVPIPAGSVNSNYRIEAPDGRWFFARVYEEQDRTGAEAEARLLDHLASREVPTPRPIARRDGTGFTVELASPRGTRPLAVFPWRAGEIVCQKRVREHEARSVGAALARTQLAARDFPEPRPGRFRIEDLCERLSRIAAADDPELRAMAPRIAEKLDRAVESRDPMLPRGIVHGDLFRDNVLWEDGRIAALLDFESACEGSFAYDLMVTVLSWCYGDDLDLALVRAMLAGYGSVRRLEPGELAALAVEGRIAALRFTITRITDFAMRAGLGERVMKDWRRFWARHERIERLGVEGLAALAG